MLTSSNELLYFQAVVVVTSVSESAQPRQESDTARQDHQGRHRVYQVHPVEQGGLVPFQLVVQDLSGAPSSSQPHFR